MGQSRSGRNAAASWPSAAQFNEAIQNLRTSMSDAELREGVAAVDTLGLPLVYSGGFADVYQVHCRATGHTWAVKCFTRGAAGLHERYEEISRHLQKGQLRVTVDFRYLDEGVRIGGTWYPIVKMRWIEGQTLNQFVGQKLDKPRMLDQLLRVWIKLSARLRQAEIAHADIQHGNVLLVAMEDQRLELKLIDYDGMYVPALAGRSSGELGHRNYQHPQRAKENIYSAEVDRFSHLAICCALRCLRIGGRPLWERFNNGENLLFREEDFLKPARSTLFKELWTLRDGTANALVGHLLLASQQTLDQTPLVEELVQDGSVQPLSSEELQKIDALLTAEIDVNDPLPFDVVDTGSPSEISDWRPGELGSLASQLRNDIMSHPAVIEYVGEISSVELAFVTDLPRGTNGDPSLLFMVKGSKQSAEVIGSPTQIGGQSCLVGQKLRLLNGEQILLDPRNQWNR